MSRTDDAVLSIIIPTVNEAGHLRRTLASIPPSAGLEVWVTDGGSSDGTPEVAAECGAHVLSGQPPRAAQMNRAVRQARGDLLLFLHADTLLPEGFAPAVRRCLSDPGTALGAFRLAVDAPGKLLRWVEKGVHWRSNRWSSPYGDQALFLRRETFAELGGFREIPIMEDYDLVLRARKLGRIEILSEAVLTSGRRWQRLGIVRTTLLNWLLVAAFHLGISPARLAIWYRGRKPAGKAAS